MLLVCVCVCVCVCVNLCTLLAGEASLPSRTMHLIFLWRCHTAIAINTHNFAHTSKAQLFHDRVYTAQHALHSSSMCTNPSQLSMIKFYIKIM